MSEPGTEVPAFLSGVVAWAGRHDGAAPTRAQWDADPRAEPDSGLLVDCYGSWSLVLLAAELRPNRPAVPERRGRPTGPRPDPAVERRRSEARRLHADGLSFAEIARRLGVSRATVSRDVRDPDRRQARADRVRRQVPCPGCGGPMTAGEGRASAMTCWDCAHALRRGHARLRVLEALRTWAAEHGQPPRAADWTSDGRVPGRWPAPSAVQRLFGSWNAALVAAGLPTRGQGRPRADEG